MKDKFGQLIRDDQTHQQLVSQSRIHKLTKEQQDVIDKIMGDTPEITLQEDVESECTMDLPILNRRG